MKIVKHGPLQLPNNWRPSGTFHDGDHTIYSEPEEKSWAGYQVSSTKREQPIAYLPETVAWQTDGTDAATSSNVLVGTSKVRSPLVPPKTVVLRNFENFEDMLAGLVALAPLLEAAGITVLLNPYEGTSLSDHGILPGLPITSYQSMEPGFGVEPVDIAIIDVEKFVGGEILEIWAASERSAFRFLKTNIQSSSNTEVFPDYDEIFPSSTDLITFHRSLQYFHFDNATGIGVTDFTSWNSSVATVLQTNPDPPPALLIHAMGVASGPDQSYGAPRFPVTRTVSEGMTNLFIWDELITHCAETFLEWIPRCTRYKGVLLWGFGTPIDDPVIFYSDTIFGLIDTTTLDGINPQWREALDQFVEEVGEENFEIDEYAYSEDFAVFQSTQLAKIVAQIEEFFDVSLS